MLACITSTSAMSCRVFRALYELDERAHQAGIAIIPGVGFGVVATNCLALYVSDAVGGAVSLEVGSRIASAQPGPGAAATMRENLPFGGVGSQRWRASGHSSSAPVPPRSSFLTAPSERCPFRRADLEAAFQATAAGEHHCLLRHRRGQDFW